MSIRNLIGTRPLSARMRGRTLIELIVAMALSLLILLGVGSLFLGANQSSRTAASVSGAEEGGSIVMTMLGTAVRRAGYSEIIGTNPTLFGTRTNLLYSGPHIRGCVGNAFSDQENNVCNGPAITGDDVVVWFQADSVLGSAQSATTDCLGNAAPLRDIVDPGFKGRIPGGQIPVVRNEYYVTGGNLVCRSLTSDPATNTTAVQPLVSNVVDFKVYYGFDDAWYAAQGAINERPASRSIHTANEINAMAAVGGYSPWEFVVSAMLCVTLRSEENGVSSTATPQYTPCPATDGQADGSAGPIASQNSPLGSIQRSYTEVFTVRSRATPTPAAPI